MSTDIFWDILRDKKHSLRVETQRSGPFTIAPALSGDALSTLLLRVHDAQKRFRNTPLHSVAAQLEREVAVRSVFGTNTIEGGELNEAETAEAMDLDPALVQREQQRRVLNIKLAYDKAKEAARTSNWQPDLEFIMAIHCQIAEKLTDEDYSPGRIRDNDKAFPTKVGDKAHGGEYKPPQFGQDISLLLNSLLDWNRNLANAGVPALIRAPLVHLYFEWIHPFYNGNGRVGRVVEASILLADGFRYAPFGQANYYLEHIHTYFTLFNTCRKRQNNTAFVGFFLEGMLATINRLHDRVNDMVRVLLYRTFVRDKLENKDINERQYAIVQAVLDHGTPLKLAELRSAAWYKATYRKLTDKTQRRDLKGLTETHLLRHTPDDRLWPGFAHPDQDIRG